MRFTFTTLKTPNMVLIFLFSLLVSASQGLDPGDLLCRSCGAFIFAHEDHIHGSVLSGPRVKSTLHSPPLGVNGTLHVLRKSLLSSSAQPAAGGVSAGSEAVVSVALYADGQSLTQERPVTPSLFPGFAQRRVVCSRCRRSVGWEFLGVEEGKEGVVVKAGKEEGEEGGGKAPGGGLRGVAEPPPGVVPYLEEEGDLRLAFLKSSPCLLLPNGWWTQVLCHQKHVEQFHEKTRWSMGKYVQQHKKERLASNVPGYYTSHFYANGQHCDETGKGRATEVQFLCCGKGEGRFPLTRDVVEAVPFIVDIQEPGLCKYVMRVCVPTLCSEHPGARLFAERRRGGEKPLDPPPPPKQGVGGGAEEGPRVELMHRPFLPTPVQEYHKEDMPSHFFLAALAALVTKEEVDDIAAVV